MFQCNKEKPRQCSAFFFFFLKEMSVSSLPIHPFNTPQQRQTKIQLHDTADLFSSQLCACSELYQLVGLFWTPFLISFINSKTAELV